MFQRVVDHGFRAVFCKEFGPRDHFMMQWAFSRGRYTGAPRYQTDLGFQWSKREDSGCLGTLHGAVAGRTTLECSKPWYPAPGRLCGDQAASQGTHGPIRWTQLEPIFIHWTLGYIQSGDEPKIAKTDRVVETAMLQRVACNWWRLVCWGYTPTSTLTTGSPHNLNLSYGKQGPAQQAQTKTTVFIQSD